jgi:hypothetical protein
MLQTGDRRASGSAAAAKCREKAGFSRDLSGKKPDKHHAEANDNRSFNREFAGTDPGAAAFELRFCSMQVHVSPLPIETIEIFIISLVYT